MRKEIPARVEVVCDRCKAVINMPLGQAVVVVSARYEYNDEVRPEREEKWDLCGDCGTRVYSFLESK